MTHIDYHVVLEALRSEKTRCPLCAFVARNETAHFESMLYSWVGTEGFQDRFLAANGFCPAHAHRLGEENDGVAVAMLYGPLLRHRRRWIAAARRSAPARAVRALKLLRDTSPVGRGARARTTDCPICEQISLWETQFIKNVLRHGDDESLREAFVAGYGLCMPHYERLLRISSTPGFLRPRLAPSREKPGLLRPRSARARVPAWIERHQEDRMEQISQAVEAYARGATGGSGGRASTVWRDLLEYMEGPAGAIRSDPSRGTFRA